MRTCKQIIELSSQQLDSKLTFFARMEVRFHLLICTCCRRYARQLTIMQKALSMMDNRSSVMHLSAPAKQRIAHKIYPDYTQKAQVKEQKKD